MFEVLETAARSVHKETFFDELREAMARWLGWRDSVVVELPARGAPFPSRADLLSYVYSNRPSSFLQEYAEKWHADNPFKTPFVERALRANGVVTLAETCPEASPLGLPFVEQYLARHGITDVAEAMIGGVAGSGMLVCVYFDDRRHLDRRDRWLLRSVSRQLAPWVTLHHGQEPAVLTQLSGRERQVADLVAHGLTNREIAEDLHVSVETVKKHLTNSMAKLDVRNRTQLALLRRSSAPEADTAVSGQEHRHRPATQLSTGKC
ncbi:helix-turn-helix transcriptional regulator [Amycolatopsis suaedae]|uniref:LuxR family transcriptional regulator n=1 Tax=Amycolatopsis suaedae TaxID=2510978 RepID=A0A4Q7J361_9PSEU|nr:helix-turn-helix transcriptional regulator [Amycolatopsis suaedae]RZQ61046.1 LuxR family transcriptional regulator [Amycolatopsis suaedae]